MSGMTTFPSLWFLLILLSPLYNNSQAPTSLLPTYINQLQVFLRVKYPVYCSVYIFINYLTCVQLFWPYSLGSYLLFSMFYDEPFECCAPRLIFWHKPYGFYCIILQNTVIFRNTYISFPQNWLYWDIWLVKTLKSPSLALWSFHHTYSLKSWLRFLP